jgi:4-amino-4-deoxy-L-arabinose transferase-like glycosyltransferase
MTEPAESTDATDVVPSPSAADTAPPAAPEAPHHRAAASPVALAAAAGVVVVAWVVLQLWGLGQVSFHTKGEPREALVVWEMTHGSSWILPRRAGIEWPSKPPLFHWLGALTALARGQTDEWSVRFPSALLSLLGALGVLGTGAVLWGPRAGLTAALTLLTTFEWARASTSARVDMTLTFGLGLAFISLLFFLRTRAAGWLPSLYLGISLAVLGKGPVGVALPGLVTLVVLTLQRDFSPLRHMRLARGGLAVLVIAGTWYVLALHLGGWDFFTKQFLFENLFRVVDAADSGDVGHRHGPLYLFGTLLLGVLPWTIFIPGVTAALWRRRHRIERGDPRVFLLVWIASVFVFYSFAISKRSVYLLALYPALALLLGWWWEEQTRQPADAWLLRALRWLYVGLIGVMLLVVAVILAELLGLRLTEAVQAWLPPDDGPYALVVGEILRTHAWMLLSCVGIAVAALAGAVLAAAWQRWGVVFAASFLATASLIVTTAQVILPAIAARESVRDFMAGVRHRIGDVHDLAFYQTFSYGAVFYWGEQIPVYTGPLADAGAPRYLLTSRAAWAAASPAVRDQYEPLPPISGKRLGEAYRLVLLRRVRTG